MTELYIDEPCVVSFFTGEIGWFLQRWQGRLRFLKREKYQDRKFVLFMNPHLHPFVNDFVAYTIDLPDWFKELKLETDCYESPPIGSPPGSLTTPDVYAKLIQSIRQFYNRDKAIEIWPPRGCNYIVENKEQVFSRYGTNESVTSDRPIICVFPRGRTRAADRNVPEFVWRELVDKLKETFFVVLGGTPGGSFLVDYESEHVLNLIKYNEEDKTDKIIMFLSHAVCSISSQSGPTHISLLCGCPSHVIGHEMKRHAKDENRFNTPTSFRYVTDYRAIDADTIISDISLFIKRLLEIDSTLSHGRDTVYTTLRPALRSLIGKPELVGAEIGVFTGRNSESMLDSLDIKKLYLIDPYKDNVAGFTREEAINSIKIEAHNRLDKYADRIVWLQKKSEDAILDIEEDLDFVYIDGNHRYEYVKKDIELYAAKVKDGGLVAGHDFDVENEGNGVQRAVKEYAEANYFSAYSAVDPKDPKTHDWWLIKESIFDNISNENSMIIVKLIQDRLA